MRRSQDSLSSAELGFHVDSWCYAAVLMTTNAFSNNRRQRNKRPHKPPSLMKINQNLPWRCPQSHWGILQQFALGLYSCHAQYMSLVDKLCSLVATTEVKARSPAARGKAAVKKPQAIWVPSKKCSGVFDRDAHLFFLWKARGPCRTLSQPGSQMRPLSPFVSSFVSFSFPLAFFFFFRSAYIMI